MSSAVVFGGTGLVGNYLIKTLINDEYYTKIKAFTRSEINITNSKLEIININFDNFEEFQNLILADSCFFCIGTTKKNSPDKDEYKRVELDIPKKIAQIAKLNSVKSFFFVSSGYADSKSSGDYLKFKGLVEEELKRLNFSKLGIMRPSFLMGNRKENRVGERLGIFTFKLISPLLLGPLKKIRPIHSDTVAKAMIKIANNDFQQNIFESNEIEELNNS